MPINFEVKDMLARLLSTEDIIIEHKNVESASFDVEKRLLILPMWEKASNVVYDLLLGHECGHALYTPNVDWFQNLKIPPQFVNIVEDARIEKMMKRRYGGLAKTFYNGYKEMLNQDFFSLEGEDISSFNLADRANLYFKVGSHLQVKFTPQEQVIVDMIADCETFDDTLRVAEILYKFCDEEFDFMTLAASLGIEVEVVQMDGDSSNSDNGSDDKGDSSEDSESRGNSGDSDNDDGRGDNNQNNQENQGSQNPSANSNKDNQDKNSQNSSNQQEKKENSTPSPMKTPPSPGSVKGSPTKVKTMDSLDNAVKSLIERNSSETVYVETPVVDLNQIIIPNRDIHDRCKQAWNGSEKDTFTEVDKAYQEFKRSAQKEVSFLLKEFECRKAADAYVRATTSRTGVLDCTKLHTYKYNDDLFKKITTRPDGKNHGLVFILDWSGSMSQILLDTLKQLFSLIWFCRKANIPFEVYAFTTDYPFITYDDYGKAHSRKSSYKKKVGLVEVGDWFSMMNMLTNKVNAATLDTQMKNLFRIAYTMNRTTRHRIKYRIPLGLTLSGTPLNESIIALHQIIPKFQTENKVQKVQCIILTDGDSCAIKYHREVRSMYNSGRTDIGSGSIGYNTMLRNRKTGRMYSFSGEWWETTTTFLRDLRDSFPDTNFIGIRIIDSRDASSFIRRYFKGGTKPYNEAQSQWKKDKAFGMKTNSYHSYFGISSHSLNEEFMFEVSEDASKSQIKNAFLKSLKTKKTNKRILTEFIDLIV